MKTSTASVPPVTPFPRRAFAREWRLAALAIALGLALPARANFHFWDVNELYSNADGSVQFIELRDTTGGQQFLGGHQIQITGPLGTNTFIFPTNLPSDSFNKTCIIGTGNLSFVPGGVVPNYIVPANFIPRGSGTVNFGLNQDIITYANLPADGVASLMRSGGSMVFAATNSPKNFNNQSNSIVPVKFSNAASVGTDFVLTFATAAGANGSGGPSYAVEANDAVGMTNWVTATNVAGDGTLKSVAIPIVPGTNRFFRLRVP